MYIYQAWDGTGWFANARNAYLWFNCNTGRWTRSVVPTGWSSCPDRFSCAGPYPTSTSYVGSAWSACPSSGSPTCSATHSHTPPTHSPSAVHSHSPSSPGEQPSGMCTCAQVNTYLSNYAGWDGCMRAVSDCATGRFSSWDCSFDSSRALSYIWSCTDGGSQVDHVCDIVNPSLAAIPQCTCTETTGGTGLVTECQESIPGLGNVGVRVQLEPCGDPAFAEMTYQFGGTSWESAGRIEAGGDPLLLPIPGASLSGAGLYISVTVTGNAADLSVHAHLSACLNDACDGVISFGVGSILTAAGFPFPLLEFDDLAFVDSCPAESSLSNMSIIAAAAGGAVVVLLGIGFWCYQKKKQVPVQPATSNSISSSAVSSSSSSSQ